MSTGDYFRFRLRKQTLANTASSAFAKHPQIVQPFFTGSSHSNDLCVLDGDPG